MKYVEWYKTIKEEPEYQKLKEFYKDSRVHWKQPYEMSDSVTDKLINLLPGKESHKRQVNWEKYASFVFLLMGIILVIYTSWEEWRRRTSSRTGTRKSHSHMTKTDIEGITSSCIRKRTAMPTHNINSPLRIIFPWNDGIWRVDIQWWCDYYKKFRIVWLVLSQSEFLILEVAPVLKLRILIERRVEIN